MTLPPGNRLLPASQRASFAQQFEKDLQFFQLLFALMNKSCPIKNIDLMWHDNEGAHRAGSHHIVGTTQALGDTVSHYVRCDRRDPNPRFCSTVSAHGKRYAQSCGRCDCAAMERVGQLGKSEVYTCHAGLVDIAVPVICEGHHIATLFSGQVLKEAPSAAGFVQIRENVRSLTYIDLEELERAYWEVPVVSEEDIQRTVRLLEIFADYLATCWKRLREAVDTQQGRIRTSQLHKKEFANLLLEGDSSDSARVRELARILGFKQYPNRILVVRPEDDEQYEPSGVLVDLVFTKVLHTVEDLTERSGNAISAHLRRSGICVFFQDRTDRPNGGGLNAHMLAERIVSAVSERCQVRVRVGIGRLKNDWRRLRDSYHEARGALIESSSSIAIHKTVTPTVRELSARLEQACRLLAEHRLKEARTSLLSLSVLATRSLGENGSALNVSRQYLCSSLESVLEAASKLGCEASAILSWRSETFEALELAPSAFELHEAWEMGCEKILHGLGMLYIGKHEKLVERVQQMIERGLQRGEGAELTLSQLAAAVGVSAGHLSRTFKHVTGSTLERYLMIKRVQRAQKLLLDPASRVSEVAEKCDFCNPAYFARVFRRIVGCSPSEFSNHPNDVVMAGNPACSRHFGGWENL